MKPQKNYIDERGDYHNVENLTLTQIHDRAGEEGYRLGKAEAKQALELLDYIKERYILVEKSPTDAPSELLVGKLANKEKKDGQADE